MKKVFELLDLRKTEGDVGIEIECEGEKLIEIYTDVWRSEDDGSLRGHFPDTRCEYILKKPIKVDEVGMALNMLKKDLDTAGAVLDFSYRCSVHVHVNVQQMQYQQLLAMIYAYYLLEEPFMTYCGKARKGNNFCLRLADAEGILDTLTRLFSHPGNLKNVQLDGNRYAAMNFESMYKYGSLEFRGMEGNLNVKRIETWCKALVKLREWAIKQDTPKAVYELYMRLGPIGFLEDVLDELVGEFQYARCIKDIQRSFSISIDLPFSFRLPAEVPEKPKKKKRFEVGQIVDAANARQVLEIGGAIDLAPGGGAFEIIRLPEMWGANPFQVAIDEVEQF